MDRAKNRERCLACKYYGRNACPLLAGADTFEIDKCILEYDVIKSIEPGSLAEFVFYQNPKEYLSYLGCRDTANYPKPGDVVVTLTAGFNSSYSGRFIRVDEEDDIQLFLSDKNGKKFCVAKEDWWKRLFKVESQEQLTGGWE